MPASLVTACPLSSCAPAAPWPCIDLHHFEKSPSPDVLLGTEGNQVMFLRNIGTNEKPEYAAPQPISLPGFDAKCYRCRIAVVDWNNDGKLDLLIGTFYSQDRNAMGGNVWLFLRK